MRRASSPGPCRARLHSHLTMLDLNQAAGIKVVEVPYKGCRNHSRLVERPDRLRPHHPVIRSRRPGAHHRPLRPCAESRHSGCADREGAGLSRDRHQLRRRLPEGDAGRCARPSGDRLQGGRRDPPLYRADAESASQPQPVLFPVPISRPIFAPTLRQGEVAQHPRYQVTRFQSPSFLLPPGAAPGMYRPLTDRRPIMTGPCPPKESSRRSPCPFRRLVWSMRNRAPEELSLLWRIHVLSYLMVRRINADPRLHSGLSLVGLARDADAGPCARHVRQ